VIIAIIAKIHTDRHGIMNDAPTVVHFPHIWMLFRKSADDKQGHVEKLEGSDAAKSTRSIRCPLCKWSPDRSSRWTCWDCGHPEYFYNGCGTEWNTFDTRGVCPTCAHPWIWTSCLSCWSWSKHEDWYGSSDE
jgi:hypothetical protein